MLMRGGTLAVLLVLGARLSEESYSREDRRLLRETERRIARDMEIAMQVQARLFPQKLPPLDTLEYAGRCIQAREVGGDDYDFLSLVAGRTGIVLADIVGKGIPGALLMANFQADVRSQCAVASLIPGRPACPDPSSWRARPWRHTASSSCAFACIA